MAVGAEHWGGGVACLVAEAIARGRAGVAGAEHLGVVAVGALGDRAGAVAV